MGAVQQVDGATGGKRGRHGSSFTRRHTPPTAAEVFQSFPCPCCGARAAGDQDVQQLRRAQVAAAVEMAARVEAGAPRRDWQPVAAFVVTATRRLAALTDDA